MCPHTSIYVSAYLYICVRIPLYMCPHASIYVSACLYICVRMTLTFPNKRVFDRHLYMMFDSHLYMCP